MTVHELSRAEARRIVVRAQLLDRPRPTDLIDVVRRLTLLQVDPTAAIAPSADLVVWSRLGSAYSPVDLPTALGDRGLIELRQMIRPSEDLALYRADMADWGHGELVYWRQSQLDWVQANDTCRRDILKRLGSSGPLRSRDLPGTCTVPWRSTGWTNNRNVTQLLEFMVLRGGRDRWTGQAGTALGSGESDLPRPGGSCRRSAAHPQPASAGCSGYRPRPRTGVPRRAA